MKTQILIVLLISCALMPICAQQSVFNEFRKDAGDCAALYTGIVEEGYPSLQYVNHPYWDTDEFQNGDICYKGLLYTNIKLRYDSFKKSLIVISPEKQIGIHVDMRKVYYFILNNKKFMLQGNNYVALLYQSPQMQLTEHLSCKLGTPVEKHNIRYQQFKRKVRYNLNLNGVNHNVYSRTSILKLFPLYKKQLKEYAKANLSFDTQRTKALIALIKYADTLKVE